MPLSKRALAEFIGTFWLVFVGCGAAIFAAGFPALGIGFIGVALAFGITVLAMAYAIGHISGCHLNPAVSIGLTVGKRFPTRELPAYILAQVLGAIAGAGLLCVIAGGKPGFSPVGGFACTGYGLHSPDGYSLLSCFLVETAITAFFVLVILGATDWRAPKGFAPIAIGLGLSVSIMASIAVTNASLNPARSTATAIFAGGWALSQLWLFWVAPILGGIIGGLISNTFFAAPQPSVQQELSR